jgi:hypothetical protein
LSINFNPLYIILRYYLLRDDELFEFLLLSDVELELSDFELLELDDRLGVVALGELPDDRLGVVVLGELPEDRLGVVVLGELPDDRVGLVVLVELLDDRLGVVVLGELPDDRLGVVVFGELPDDRLGVVVLGELPDDRLGVVVLGELPDDRLGVVVLGELPDDRLGVIEDVPEEGFLVPVLVAGLVVIDELPEGVEFTSLLFDCRVVVALELLDGVLDELLVTLPDGRVELVELLDDTVGLA